MLFSDIEAVQNFLFSLILLTTVQGVPGFEFES
jgi:hypothetical protein